MANTASRGDTTKKTKSASAPLYAWEWVAVLGAIKIVAEGDSLL